MHLLSHRRTTAWLGLIAMWLIVFAPIVSRLLASEQHQHLPTAAICTAIYADAGSGDVVDSAHHPDKAPTTAACGYCDLLATHAVVPAIAPAMPSQIVLVALAAPAMPIERAIPLGAFPSGRPREPPALS
ncbi:MAG TPA: DUF2946 domain-containing protein [Trinickia sp.]